MLEALGIALFIVGLLVSIALHEIGHLVPAKRFGVRVTQYMVGFGPTVWSRRVGETEYGLKALPFGGYIRMVGMFPPRDGRPRPAGRVGALIEQAREDSLAEIAPGEHHRAFYHLSVPRKLAVMTGGPLMNLALSAVLFGLALSVVGTPTPTLTVARAVACVPTAANPTGMASTDGSCTGSAAAGASVAGITGGDRIVSVAETEVTTWSQISPALRGRQGETVTVVIERAGQQLVLPVVVGVVDDPQVGQRAFIGVTPTFVPHTVPVSEVPGVMWGMSLRAGKAIVTWPVAVSDTATSLFTSDPRDPNGPVSVVGVGRISGQVAADSRTEARYKAVTYLQLLASMNLFLFLFNLLPILPLDGGHVAGAVYEGARRMVWRVRGKGRPGAADTAKLVPVAYAVSLILLAMSLVVMIADVIKPISLG